MLGIFRRSAAAALVALVAAGCDASSGRDGNSQSQPGDLALDYLSGNQYRSIRVEVDYIEGKAPSTAALDRAREIFERRLDKPDGVRFTLDSEIPASFGRPNGKWEINDILELESRFRNHHTGDSENRNAAVIWMVYLDGGSEFDDGPTRALGLAYGGSDVAIFSDNLEATTISQTRDIVEAMVVVHEGGHLFGLVNNGIPMVNDHEDEDHERHDLNDNCVMYHKIETADTVRLLESPPIDFDFQCRLDMYAAGGLPPDEPQGEPTPLPRPRIPSGGSRGPIPDLATIPGAR